MLKHRTSEEQTQLSTDWRKGQPLYRITQPDLKPKQLDDLEAHCVSLAADLCDGLSRDFQVIEGNPEKFAERQERIANGDPSPRPTKEFSLPWKVKPVKEFFILDDRDLKDTVPGSRRDDTPVVLAHVEVFETSPVSIRVKDYPTEDGLGHRTAERLLGVYNSAESFIQKKESTLLRRYMAGTGLGMAVLLGLLGVRAGNLVSSSTSTPEHAPAGITTQIPSYISFQRNFEQKLGRAENLFAEGTRNFRGAKLRITTTDIVDIRNQMGSLDAQEAAKAIDLYKRTVILGFKSEGRVFLDSTNMSSGEYTQLLNNGTDALRKVQESTLSGLIRNKAGAAIKEIDQVKLLKSR